MSAAGRAGRGRGPRTAQPAGARPARRSPRPVKKWSPLDFFPEIADLGRGSGSRVGRYVAFERFGVRAARALAVVLVVFTLISHMFTPPPLKIAISVLRFRIHVESEHSGSDLEAAGGRPRGQRESTNRPAVRARRGGSGSPDGLVLPRPSPPDDSRAHSRRTGE